VKGFSRRQWLKGLAWLPPGLSTLVPRLEIAAAEGEPPKRIVFVLFPNGVIQRGWDPTGTATDFALGPTMRALQPHKNDLLILRGLDMSPKPSGPHSGHAMLLSNRLPQGNRRMGMGVTLDQTLGQEIGKENRFSSLELAVVPNTGDNSYRREFSYRGARDPVPWEFDPFAFYARLVGMQDGEEAAKRLLTRRQSVLDRVRADLARAQSKLGMRDRMLLDQHVQSLREVERAFVAASVGCSDAKDPGKPLDVKAHRNYVEIGQVQTDLLVNALACDATRVATFVWSGPTSGQRFTWLGENNPHHAMSHNPGEERDGLLKIDRWYVDQFAGLIEALKARDEIGGGSLFANTLLVLANPLSDGNRHQKTNLPIVMAGGGWHFKTGRQLDFGGTPHGRWLVSIAQAMGLSIERYGDPETSKGPLDGLV